MQTNPAPPPTVIHADEEFIVLSKPAGWLSIPGRKPDTPVITDWAKKEFGLIFTVHRLDVDTSGVLLLARTAEAHRKASLWFQKHEIRKSYHFLAQGTPLQPSFKIQSLIEAKKCTTLIHISEKYKDCFLGEALPLTGKRHQIRIHLSGEGHPILGDQKYGGHVQWGSLSINRVALHARSLKLPDGRCFTAPYPDDLEEWKNTLKKD